MKTIVRLDPFSEFRTFANAMERLMDGTSGATPTQANWVPMDITETEQQLIIRASVPGINPADIHIQVEEGVLTISGESKQEATTENERVYRREIRTGSFRRSLRLPENLDFENATASHDHGVLEVRIARIPEPAPRVIKIGVQPTLEGTGEPSPN